MSGADLDQVKIVNSQGKNFKHFPKLGDYFKNRNKSGNIGFSTRSLYLLNLPLIVHCITHVYSFKGIVSNIVSVEEVNSIIFVRYQRFLVHLNYPGKKQVDQKMKIRRKSSSEKLLM